MISLVGMSQMCAHGYQTVRGMQATDGPARWTMARSYAHLPDVVGQFVALACPMRVLYPRNATFVCTFARRLSYIVESGCGNFGYHMDP